tara:strand:+ start:762 stop:1754 length:993 start_codon:yes stop_codon:yes gene_type:complete
MSADKVMIKEMMMGYGETFKNLVHPEGVVGFSQSELYKALVPDEPEDCTKAFTRAGLDKVFTCSNFSMAMKGNWNCNHIHRDVNRFPVILLWSSADGKVVILGPLGDPGRHFKKARVSHMMVVSTNRGNPVFTEFLPSNEEEMDDLSDRMGYISQFVQAMRDNTPISECGPQVLAKASMMGVHSMMGVRDWMKHQIKMTTPEWRSERPYYKLFDSNDVDIVNDEERVSDEIDAAFGPDMKPNLMIQSPVNNTQVTSHIHLVMSGVDDVIPDEVQKNYFDLNAVYEVKMEMMDDAPLTRTQTPPIGRVDAVDLEQDDGVSLSRQSSVRVGE